MNACVKMISLFLTFFFIFTGTIKGEDKTLVRHEDFIVITGSDAPGLIGQKLSDFRLYSCQKNSCNQVPFQIDKLDFMDRYVFPGDKNSDRDGDSLDKNDEIVFMISDTGDRIPSSYRPENSKKGAEIEVRDPLDNGVGWVYLFFGKDMETQDVPDYISHRVEDGNVIIESEQVILGYETGRISYDKMRMRTSSGEMGPDVLDRQRVGIKGELSGDKGIEINAPESLIQTKDIGVIDGPVRVIIDQVIVMHLGALKARWGGEYFMKYYRCGQHNSVDFDFPAALNQLFKSLFFYWSLDFSDEILSSSYYDQNNKTPVPIKTQTVKNVPNDSPHYWWGMTGPNGTLVQALDLDDNIKENMICDGLWNQDPDAKDKKGNYPGKIEIGFGCHEKEKLPSIDKYHWFNYILFPEKSSKKNMYELVKLIEHPVEISVSEIMSINRQ